MPQQNDGLATIEGTIYELEETKQYGQKGFRKRMMMVISDDSDPNDQYATIWPIAWTGDDVDMADDFRKGTGVRVQIEVSGRKWDSPQKGTMYFAEFKGKRITMTRESDLEEVESAVEEGDVPF